MKHKTKRTKKTRTVTLKALIGLRLLTQAELAERIGMHQPDVSRYCADRVTPRVDVLRKIGEVLAAKPIRTSSGRARFEVTA